MTPLSLHRPLVRATGYTVERRELVVELTPEGAYLRGKGTRRRYFMSWAQLYVDAVRVTVMREKAEKKRLRAERRVA